VHQIPLARVYAKGAGLDPSGGVDELEAERATRSDKTRRTSCPRWCDRGSRHGTNARLSCRTKVAIPKIICTTRARRELDCSLPIPDISSRTLLARAPHGRRSGATQADGRVFQGPQATRGGLMIGHVIAFLDGREPNTSAPGGRLEEASTACQLNRIRRA
jgi:hypothetical protein